MSEIMNDMDLALEGVPVSESNQNIQMGLAILEHKMPEFHYSHNNLSLSEKVNEIKRYYLCNGYTTNTEILNEISSDVVSVTK